MIHYLLVCYIYARTKQIPTWKVVLSLGFVQQNPDSISTHEITTHFRKLGYDHEAIDNALYELPPIENCGVNMHKLKDEFYEQLKPQPKYK